MQEKRSGTQIVAKPREADARCSTCGFCFRGFVEQHRRIPHKSDSKTLGRTRLLLPVNIPQR